MTIAESEQSSRATPHRVRELRSHAMHLVGRLAGAVRLARTTATSIAERVPGTLDATRARAHDTTSALQTLPDPTLRGLAATSLGLGAGFYLARAPRLAIAAGVAPAVILGAAILLRPIEPVVTADATPGRTAG